MENSKPYSENDLKEIETLTVLGTLVDPNLVMLKITPGDKHPNTDGTIELLDENHNIVGELAVQLKSLPKDCKSFSCDSSLVNHSKNATSLPVILIYVNPENKTAYWKHIYYKMPEYIGKESQKSFTIHFSDIADKITKGGIYRTDWLSITDKYSKSTAEFPNRGLENVDAANSYNIDPEELVLFQTFIQAINNNLDNEFPVVKELVFPGVWMLGVGILPSNQRIQYRIYRIPYKKIMPSVSIIDPKDFFSGKYDRNIVSETIATKEYLRDPRKMGKQFVLKILSSIVEKRELPVYGVQLSSDVLFSFIDKYHIPLGLPSEIDEYSTIEISHALTKFTAKNNTIYDALSYLVKNEIGTITRLFPRYDKTLLKMHNFIWSGYSQEKQIEGVKKIIEYSIEEYQIFTKGNRLNLEKGKYLDPSTSIVYVFRPGGNTIEQCPILSGYFINTTKNSCILPKTSFFIENQELRDQFSDTDFILNINGNKYRYYSAFYRDAGFFFDNQTPFMNIIYEMLREDLKACYDIDIRLRI